MEPIICLRDIEIRPYLISDTTYPSRPYMIKNYKPADPTMVDKIKSFAYILIHIGGCYIDYATSTL
jgi:hypothetical protein